MIAYTGIETISNMSEEAVDPARTIPRGTGYVVIAVLVLYALLPIVALSAMPVIEQGGQYTTELGTTYAGDPVLGIVENLGLGATATEVLRVYVGILAAVILVIATNAALIGVSRLTFSMGQYRQLPERLRQVHPKYRTPYVAILVFSGIAALAIIPGETDLLATMYSFGAMLSFTIAHVSVAWMRVRHRDHPKRLWTPPGNLPVRGHRFPVTALIGGLGTFAAWIVVMALNTTTLAIGGAWMLIGIVGYAAYRRHCGLPLTETSKPEMLEPVGVDDVESESVLVSFEDDPYSELTVATAVRFAARRGRNIHVLSLVNVPAHLPIDAPLQRQVAKAQEKVQQAKILGGARVSGHVERIRPGQAGQAIIEEVRQIDARALVMQLTYRGDTPLYGKTLQTVLSGRPCQVIVVADPTGEGLSPKEAGAVA